MRGLCVCLTLCLASPALASEVAVFVTPAQVPERKQVDDATKKDLKAKKDAASEARKALEKEIKAQHGKKREAWPAEQEDRMAAAEEVAALANAGYEYLKVETKALKDSAKDVTEELNGLVKQKVVALAPSAAEADVVLQIEGRRGEKTLPTYLKPDQCYVLFSLGPGGKPGAAERFAKVPPSWRPRKIGSYKVQAPKPESPVFVFESNNGFGTELGCFSAAADAAAKTLQKMIEENRALAGS
jgi:hypothetical protein